MKTISVDKFTYDTSSGAGRINIEDTFIFGFKYLFMSAALLVRVHKYAPFFLSYQRNYLHFIFGY